MSDRQSDMPLLPCPFCGEATHIGVGYLQGKVTHVICDTDNCMGNGNENTYRTETDAVAAWNHRADALVQTHIEPMQVGADYAVYSYGDNPINSKRLQAVARFGGATVEETRCMASDLLQRRHHEQFLAVMKEIERETPRIAPISREQQVSALKGFDGDDTLGDTEVVK